MYNYGEGIGSSNQGRSYQGYPYANPMVIDVPSIDAATAARYKDLPRKPYEGRSDDNPVVYIDIPSSAGGQSAVSRPMSVSSEEEDDPQLPQRKLDPDDNPVVYIDLPESSGSDVADRRRVEEDSFVGETIFYDPFKDRRIQMDPSDSGSGAGSSTGCSGARPGDFRPAPPHSLDLGSSSRGYGSSNYEQSNLPASYSKESLVYGSVSSPHSGYRSSDRDFPEPPPAYTENYTPQTVGSPSQVTAPSVEPPSQEPEPPRTQVIIPPDSNPDRKFIYCIYCGVRAHTLIIKQSGTATHVIAWCFAICGLFPLTIFIYCTDFCKYNNHYCKNCNQKLAYEIPIVCKELTYYEAQ